MTINISRKLRNLVRERARYCCEYCCSSEWLSGQVCHIDHIIPLNKEGTTNADNLCLACAACNASKLDFTQADDPISGETTALFNPRQQVWHEHFRWDETGTQIIGLTSCGRATIELLGMNRPLIVAARVVWVSVNRHPPKN